MKRIASPQLRLSLALLLALFASPAAQAWRPMVGKDYQPPTNSPPSAYKYADPAWKAANPADTRSKGNWWEMFQDPALNELEARATTNNPTLQAAVARVTQARAMARVARSEFLPELRLDPSAQWQRYSRTADNQFPITQSQTLRMPVDLSYELDIWGRVRRAFEGARADATASEAAFATIRLTLHADVAQTYFTLRATEADHAVVERGLALRREVMAVVRTQFNEGIVSELDVARAESELAATEVEYHSVARRRAELENALALLTGTTPGEFKLGTNTVSVITVPDIPAGLPGELLERRPDVAEAERTMAGANARIGVARAAFFPVVRLTGNGGFESGDITSLLNWESRVWSLGPSVSIPLFQGGRNRANVKRAEAALAEAGANYRVRVLTAFREVEDALAGQRLLARQAAAQSRAYAAARHASDLSITRYKGGLVGFLELVDAERTALLAERQVAQLHGQRLVTSVLLIKALGGGWNAATNTLAPVK